MAIKAKESCLSPLVKALGILDDKQTLKDSIHESPLSGMCKHEVPNLIESKGQVAEQKGVYHLFEDLAFDTSHIGV